MPTFGNTSTTGYRNDTQLGGTVVAGVATMPVNGWITEVHVHANGSGATVNRRLGLWDKDRARIYNGPVVSMGSGANWRTDAGLSVRVAGGQDLWIGIYGAGDFQVRVRDDFPNEKREQGGQSGIPPTLAGTVEPDRVACYCDYVANFAPSVGTWRPEAPSGIISSANPTFAGNTPHPAGDSAYDHTSEVHLQVWRASDGAMVYDSLFATTTSERDQGYFSRSASSLGLTLGAATTYRAKFRHRDSWGVYPASFSSEIEFTTSDIPAPPSLTSPSGKINAISGHNYVFLYTHPNGLAANAKQIQVWNSTGSSLLFDSGTLAISPAAASGETISTPEFHADLAWGTAYKWRARARDTSNNWSQYSPFKDFNTNAAPNAPTPLSPIDNKTTLSRAFSAAATDPDGDAITAAEIEIVNVDTGAVVAGYPAAMTVSGGQSLAYTAPASGTGSLTLNTNYKWRARATDGIASGYGAWSGYEFFRHADVPTVALLTPDPQRTNLTKQPSAEHDPATLSAYWTETARTANDFINRVADGDAAFGIAAWEGVASAGGDDRFREAGYEAVDATKPYVAKLWMKKKSGASAAHFALLCYDNENTLLGTVYPSSVRLANGADVPDVWTEFGGIVWPADSGNSPTFPTGTTKVRREVTPSRNSAGVVRFDALTLEQVPALSASDFAGVRNWYGYGDPDEALGRDTPMTAGYAWADTPGDSASTLLHVLTSPAAYLAISYSSGSALAKKDDRTIIEEWDGQAYGPVLDTGFPVEGQGSARTLIPVPSGYLRNGGRYRIKVQARDTAEAVGESDWVEMDVRYDGPAEPNVLLSEADPSRAQLKVTISPWSGTAQEFAHLEVAREALDGSEPPETVERIPNPSATQILYRFPRSGAPYRLKARFVRVQGSTLVEGRWANVVFQMTYEKWFLKAVDDPTLEVGAAIYSGDPVNVENTLPVAGSYRPLFSSTRVHYAGVGRDRSSTLVVRVFDDEPDRDQKVALMERITAERPTLCLLAQRPPEKRFVFPTRVSRLSAHVPEYAVYTVDIEDTRYAEDVYAREGR